MFKQVVSIGNHLCPINIQVICLVKILKIQFSTDFGGDNLY